MSAVRFISDLHISHEWMAEHRGFSSTSEHYYHIIQSWNSVVSKRDVTYLIGDITMEKCDYEFLDLLNGRKIVVGGNHDMWKHSKALMKYVDGIAGCLSYKGVIISHIPIHPRELNFRFKYNIHGHLHENSIMQYRFHEKHGIYETDLKDERYICVSAEQIDYKPKTLEELGINRSKEARKQHYKSRKKL